MKRVLRLLLVLVCFSLPAFATCPSGSTYTIFGASGALVSLSSSTYNITNCRYIAANGSDANDGLSEASGHPWAHAPGMPGCTSACATLATTCNGGAGNCKGYGFIFRGDDTWHFGNSGLTPYTGGTWTLPYGTYATCNYDQSNSGCIYFGVDQSWYSGGSWARPIMTADNAACTAITCGVSGPPYVGGVIASCAEQVGGSNKMIQGAPATILDNFEMTGFCVTDANPSGDQDTMIPYDGTGLAGTGYLVLNNLYFHGWTVTATAGTQSSGTVTSCTPGSCIVALTLIGGGANGLMSIDHLVVDGSDSNPLAAAWGTFPSFYHFKDSIVRYTTQGIGAWCHDIHDNIFEYFYPAILDQTAAITHANILECNEDASGDAANQPANTPNVFYNNVIRHATTHFSQQGQVTLWFCPTKSPEYWFNNLEYDVGNSNYWDIAGAPTYNCASQGTGSGPAQFMFNNTLMDGTQPCYLPIVTGGGTHLTINNEHLINTPLDGSSGTACTGVASATNIAMSDATATTQGYASTTGRINTQNSSTNCANDPTLPCEPTLITNGTVGTGTNHASDYCATLASYSSEAAIGTYAAAACQIATTNGCTYNSGTNSMSCPAQTATTRPASGAWNSGAYEFSASAPAVLAPSAASFAWMQEDPLNLSSLWAGQ